MKILKIGMMLAVVSLSAGCGKQSPPLAGGKPIEHWLDKLNDPDARIRREAVAKLGNVGLSNPTAFPAVVRALRDRDAEVRCEAVIAVVKFGKTAREATSELTRLQTEDGDSRVREYAARAMAKITAPSRA